MQVCSGRYLAEASFGVHERGVRPDVHRECDKSVGGGTWGVSVQLEGKNVRGSGCHGGR